MLYFALFNNNCIPQIPSKGSVGASGDLAPLSHMALPLIGIGKVKFNNKTISAKEALRKMNINSLSGDSSIYDLVFQNGEISFTFSDCDSDKSYRISNITHNKIKVGKYKIPKKK